MEDKDQTNLEPKWKGEKWMLPGPLILEGRNPFCRIPCIWCGSDNHSVYTEMTEEGGTARVCPFYNNFNSEEGVIVLTSDLLAGMSSYDRSQVDDVVDKFQFQGLGWYMDFEETEVLREATKLKCDEERASWTFKREITNLNGIWPSSEILIEEE